MVKLSVTMSPNGEVLSKECSVCGESVRDSLDSNKNNCLVEMEFDSYYGGRTLYICRNCWDRINHMVTSMMDAYYSNPARESKQYF